MSVYAVADLHGRYDLFIQIKNFLTENDTCYVLGDCADRGPDGWRIIREVFADSRFIYIKGNHEDLLTHAMKNYLHFHSEDKQFFFSYDIDYTLYIRNGGKKTFEDWSRDNHKYTWMKKIEALPEHLTYINTFNQKVELTHAGYTPSLISIPQDLLWNRNHFYDKWNNDAFSNTYIIHGHTPTPHLFETLNWTNNDTKVPPGALKYAGGHKIDIDVGSFFTGYTVLLNLDTFEEQIFTADDYVYGR